LRAIGVRAATSQLRAFGKHFSATGLSRSSAFALGPACLEVDSSTGALVRSETCRQGLYQLLALGTDSRSQPDSSDDGPDAGPQYAQFSGAKLASSESIRRCRGIVGLLLKGAPRSALLHCINWEFSGAFRNRPGLDWIPTISLGGPRLIRSFEALHDDSLHSFRRWFSPARKQKVSFKGMRALTKDFK
jgi:hypothetical protein